MNLGLLLTAAALLLATNAAPADQGCGGVWTITFYAASDYPGVVADGSTTTWNALARGEAIVASVSLPMGTQVEIDGLGTATVRDTGYLGACQLDYLVADHWQAMQLGRQTRAVRVLPAW